MCKKAVFTTVAVALALLVLGQTRAGYKLFGLAELAWNKIGINANKSVPLDWEIARIENEITKIERDIKKNFDALAQEFVSTENLKKDVELVRANLKDREQPLKEMRRKLETDAQHISFANRDYNRSQFEGKFTREWNSYVVAKKDLELKEKQLGQKQDHVEALKAKIESIKNARDDMKIEVARLKTELEEVRTSQNRCKVQIDDSRLARIKADLAEVQDRIKVQKKRAELEAQFNTTPGTVATEDNNNKLEVNKAKEGFDSAFGEQAKVAAGEEK